MLRVDGQLAPGRVPGWAVAEHSPRLATFVAGVGAFWDPAAVSHEHDGTNARRTEAVGRRRMGLEWRGRTAGPRRLLLGMRNASERSSCARAHESEGAYRAAATCGEAGDGTVRLY